MNTTQANPIQTQHVSAKSKIQFPTPFETMEQRRRRPPTQPQPQLQLPLHSEEAASLLREALFRLEAEEGPQAQALGGGSRYGASGVIGIRGGGRGGGGAFSSDDDGAKTDDDDDDDDRPRPRPRPRRRRRPRSPLPRRLWPATNSAWP